MTAVVKLIEARNGVVFKVSELCKVGGKIPVYADEGFAAGVHARELGGYNMLWKGEKLPVHVAGAKAVTKKASSYATASVSVLPPDAVPLCPDLCGPQPLAVSSAEIRASGRPRFMSFSLTPNPVSMLNAKPTVWLEADIEILD
ncbi:conserved hypothetical protein [Massilia sp. 9I]|nr:conserved hypothetical protein [Massilia sp. 9I]